MSPFASAPGLSSLKTVRCDWKVARTARRYGRIILAGGLTPENVAEAIRIAQPYAVDVASGVESRPGKKDYEKMRRFIESVQRADVALMGAS